MQRGVSLATSNCVVGHLAEFVKQALTKRGAVVMAVVNTTPDSFYDGGRYLNHDAARRHIEELISLGADMIDVGAESTRPGAPSVSADEQIARALPAVEFAVSRGVCVSIDTTSPEVAREMAARGAKVINDVSCGQNPELARVAAQTGCDLILMHSRGTMTTMPGFSQYSEQAYGDIVADVRAEWSAAREVALSAGLTGDRIFFDPGLGFHKNAEQSSELMRRLDEFQGLGAGLVLGASRKSFIGALDNSVPEDRMGGSIAACLLAVQKGAQIVRVHDVQATAQALLGLRHWSRRGAPIANRPHV